MPTAISTPSRSSSQQLGCLATDDSHPHVSYLSLRVAGLFIILVSSTLGALLPVLLAGHARAHSGITKVPRGWLNFAKHFGSGIILGTAFIHLLAPGIEALGNPCLSPGWRKYPFALGLCLSSTLGIFVVEIVSMSYGARRRTKAEDCNNSPDLDLYVAGSAAEAGSNSQVTPDPASAYTSVIGLAILEFGAILHSVLIGLTLAVDIKFKVLFAVLVIHQVFEGLGIGSRLATVSLPARYAHLPIVGAVVFGMSTPLGMVVGLVMHASYNADDPGALVVSGVLDSLSAGILLYTALVELLGREILFNEELMNGPVKHLGAAVLWVLLGCCVMGLLGKWV